MDAEQQRTPFSGREVFHWPEFKALAERLGIPELPGETGLSITLDVGEPARFAIRALCRKTKE